MFHPMAPVATCRLDLRDHELFEEFCAFSARKWKAVGQFLGSCGDVVFLSPSIGMSIPYDSIAMTDPNGAIYGVPWIPSRNTPFMLAFFYQHHGSVMGYV